MREGSFSLWGALCALITGRGCWAELSLMFLPISCQSNGNMDCLGTALGSLEEARSYLSTISKVWSFFFYSEEELSFHTSFHWLNHYPPPLLQDHKPSRPNPNAALLITIEFFLFKRINFSEYSCQVMQRADFLEKTVMLGKD